MAPLIDKFIPSKDGSTTPTNDYSADEFEEDDDQADKGLTDKYVVSMDEADEALLGTSKFGGGADDDGKADDVGNDSFDEAFEKGDESQPPVDDELEDFMV